MEVQAPASDLAFTDVLPSGVTIASPANASTSCPNGVVAAPAGGTTIALSGGGVGVDESCQVVVNVTSAVPGTHMNVSGDLTSSAGNSGSATADLVVDGALPGFTKRFSPASVAVGGRSTLTLTIDNTQNQLSADQATFTDTLPAGLLIATPSNASTSCTGGILPPILTANPGTNVVSLTWDFAAAGATCNVSVDVLPTSAGLFGNLTGNLSSTRGNSGKAASTLAANLGFLSKTFVGDPVAPGGTVTLRLTLVHADRVNAAAGITFADDLDATLTGLVATGLPLANPCGAGSQLSGTSLLTLTGGNLSPEGSCSFDVTLQVPSAATPGAYLNTTSDISATVAGSPAVFPPATDSLVVQPIPLLTKSFTDDPVVGGDTVTMEFTLTNGSTTVGATGITFTDNLNAMLSGTTVNTLPAPGFCGAGSTLSTSLIVGDLALQLNNGDLPAGGSCTFSVVLNVPVKAAAGNHLNTTSSVTATVGGSTYSGAPATGTLQVVGAPRLTKAFTDDPVLPGGTVTLQFTLA